MDEANYPALNSADYVALTDGCKGQRSARRNNMSLQHIFLCAKHRADKAGVINTQC